jgi:L-amino acid N-acyltransferase YncA
MNAWENVMRPHPKLAIFKRIPFRLRGDRRLSFAALGAIAGSAPGRRSSDCADEGTEGAGNIFVERIMPAISEKDFCPDNRSANGRIRRGEYLRSFASPIANAKALDKIGCLRRGQDNSLLVLRRAARADLPAITRIYNEAILTTTATFDTQRQSVRQRQRWFRQHRKNYPIIVAEFDDKVVGWASLSPWSARVAYRETAETSFYVKSEYRGRGIGRRLKSRIIAEARQLGFRSLIAQVAEGSEASLRVNKRAGFRHAGTLQEVGRKFGKLLDVHILQKMLK